MYVFFIFHIICYVVFFMVDLLKAFNISNVNEC